MIAQKLGRNSEAQQFFEDLTETENDRPGVRASFNLSGFCRDQGDYEGEADYFDKILDPVK